MPTLDDPWEPQDTIPGSQPQAPGTRDLPLPQVAEAQPRPVSPPAPDETTGEEPVQVAEAPVQPQQSQQQQPQRFAPDGTPLPPGTIWGRAPGVGRAGPYTRPVTEGAVPAWLGNQAWQVLGFRRERVPDSERPRPGGYTPYTPYRELPSDPGSPATPNGLDNIPVPDPAIMARDYEQRLSPRLASERNVGYVHSLFNAVMDPALRSAGADIPRGLQTLLPNQQTGLLGDAADTIDGWIADNFQINPEYRSDIFVNTIAPIFGNVLGIAASLFLTAGIGTGTMIAARGLGLAGRAAAGAGAVSARTGIAGTILGANNTVTAGRAGALVTSYSQNAAEVYRDALEHGASWDDIMAASRYNGVLSGSLDVLPVFHAFAAIDQRMGNVLQRGILRAISENKFRVLETGFSEMATEAAQQVTENLIASNLVAYDPTRDTFNGVGDSAIGGFSAGAMLQMILNMLPGGRRVHNPNNNPPSSMMGRPGGPGGPNTGGGGPALTGGPGFPGSPAGPGGPGGLPGPGPGPNGPIDPNEMGPAPTGIEGNEDLYFSLPPPPDRTQFLRGQQQRIRELDAAWKKDRPDYVGDPIVGASLEFYNYLVRSEADFERLRNLPPERAAQPDVQARMREIEANRDVIDLLMDPVRMVNRPVWILQRPGKGKAGGQTIQLAVGSDGQPIRRDGARQRVVGTDGKDYFIGSSQVMQIDNTAPENVVISPQGQNVIRLARLRMSGELSAREAQATAEAQARADAAAGEVKGGQRSAQGQRALPAPSAATAQRLLPAPQGRTFGPGFTMFDDTAPATPEAAQQAAAQAAQRMAQPQGELFNPATTNSIKPETAPAGVAHEPLTPPALTENEQLAFEGLTQTSGQQLAAGQRASELGAAGMAALIPKRVTLEDLTGETRQKLDTSAIRAGVKLPETFNRQELLDAGVPQAEVEGLFASIDNDARAASTAALAQEVQETPALLRGIPGIMQFFKDLPIREQRALRKMLQHFERHIGPAISELDVLDLANWMATADANLIKSGKPARMTNNRVGAAYLNERVRAIADNIKRAAIALRSEGAHSPAYAQATRRVAHELTHFMIGLTGQSRANMAQLWLKISMNMQSDPTYLEVMKLYGGDPRFNHPAVLAEEFLAKKVEAAMAGRYETAFEKLRPGEDPSLRTYIAEFIRRLVQYVADAYDWVLGKDIINTVFNNLAQQLQVNLDTYVLQRKRPDPYSPEGFVEVTDEEVRADKDSGDPSVGEVRDAALSYFVVVFKGDRTRVNQAMTEQFAERWTDLPAETRTAATDAAVVRTEGYTDLKLVYKKNLLIGAPQNPRSFTELFEMALFGQGKDGKGKLWYELSAEEMTAQFGENAMTFLRYLSVTSPQNRVGPNTGQGINAYAQAMLRPHAKIGAYPELGISGVGTPSVTVMANALKETGDWSKTATKTQSFYRALAEDLELSGVDFTGVVDRWMMRAFGFNTDNPTPGQYTHARLIMRTIADALGWKVKWVQAAIWCAIKLRSPNPLDWDVRNYGDFIKLEKGALNFEIRPSENFAISAMFSALGYTEQKKITEVLVANIFPGMLRTLNMHHFNPLFDVSHGGYLAQQSPSVETRIPLPEFGINMLANAIGFVFRQDSVLVTHIEGYGAYIKNPTAFAAITFNGQEEVSDDSAKRLWDHIIKVDPKLGGGYSVQGNKMLFFNLQADDAGVLRKQPMSKLANNTFVAAIEAAIATYPTNDDIDISPPGEAEARLVANDWKANQDGESYAEALERLRPGITDELRVARAHADQILSSEFAQRGLDPTPIPHNTVGRPVTAPVPVGGPVDVRDGSPRQSATQNELQGVANQEIPLAGVEPGVFAEKQIYERYGQTQPGVDTTQFLKIYPLDLLVQEPQRVNQMLLEHQATMKEFSFEAEPGVEEVIPRLGVDGYHKGTIWIYNPKVQNASFRDEHYTRAWRASHELAHGITEMLMQKKYGPSRRYARLGRSMMGERGKGEKAIMVKLEPLTLREAQRAVEWEHVAFLMQRKLLKRMGVEITDDQFAQEYNINISDAVYRTVTGQFGNAGQLGFVPATEQKDIADTLWLLERYENAIANEQGRNPTMGMLLTQWEETTDAELDAALEASLAKGLAAVAVHPKDDFPGEIFTKIDPGMAEDLYTGQAYNGLRAAIYSTKLKAGTVPQWLHELRVARVPMDELRWSGLLDWLKRRSGGRPITADMMRNFINSAEMLVDGTKPGVLVLKNNPSDPISTEVTIRFAPRVDSAGRTLMHVTGMATDQGRERTLLAGRRAAYWAVQQEFDGFTWAGDTIRKHDPNWRDNNYRARLPSGVTFKGVFVPKTETAHIGVIHVPANQRGAGEGSRIVEQFEAAARAKGARRIEGEALPGSVKFWEGRGYIVATKPNANGLHPMTKFIGPEDPENRLPMREAEVTPDEIAAAVGKDFGVKIEKVMVAHPSAAQDADTSPPSAVEDTPPTMKRGKAIIFNEQMTDSIDTDTSGMYFAAMQANPMPGYPPPPNNPNWTSYWARFGAWFRRFDWLFKQSSKRIRVVSGNVPAGYDLSNHFRRDPWRYIAPNTTGTIVEDYHGVLKGLLGPVLDSVSRKLSTLSKPALRELANALRGGNVNPATGLVQLVDLSPADARWFRRWLDAVLDLTNAHMQGRSSFGMGPGVQYVRGGLTPNVNNDLIGRVPNYFPQVWQLDGTFRDGPFKGVDKAQIAKAYFKGLNFFDRHQHQDQEIEGMVAHIMGEDGYVSYAGTNNWQTGSVTKFSSGTRTRVLSIDPNIRVPVTHNGVTAEVTLNDFLNNNPLEILPRYAIGMMRHAEFNRRFGPKGEEIDRLMKNMQAQRRAAGMSDLRGEKLQTVINMIHANFHALKRPSPRFNKNQEMLKAYANLSMLAFTTIASIPEALMAGVRTGFRGWLPGLASGLNQVLHSVARQGDTDKRRIAKELGVIADQFQHSLLEMATNQSSFAVTRWQVNPQRVTDGFFYGVILSQWTNIGRVIATSAAMHALPHWAEKAAAGGPFASHYKRWLQEVGLTHQDMAGFNPATYSPGQNVKIDAAIRQIVGEIIIAPHPGMLPGWMSDPRLKLVAHIKAFMVGFGNTVLQRPIRELAHGNPFPLFWLAAYVAVAALVGKLWEYFMWGPHGNPAWQRAGLQNSPTAQLVLTAASRGGIAMPYQMFVDTVAMNRTAQGGSSVGQWIPGASVVDRLMNLGGALIRMGASGFDNPRAAHDIVNNLTLLTPGIGQLGGWRQYLVDSIAPSPGRPPAGNPLDTRPPGTPARGTPFTGSDSGGGRGPYTGGGGAGGGRGPYTGGTR